MKFVLALAAIGLAAFQFGCGSSNSSSGSTPSAASKAAGSSPVSQAISTVKICGLMNMTGSYAGYDTFAEQGVQMGMKEVNDAGGFTVGGQKYKFDEQTKDLQSNPNLSQTSALECTSQYGAHILLGPLVSVTMQPVLNVVKDSGYLYITGCTLCPQFAGSAGYETMIPEGATDAYNASKLAAPELKAVGGAKTLGVLWQDDATSRSIIGDWGPDFQAAGATIDTVYYPPSTTDFTPFLLKLKSDSPDAVFLGYTEAASLQIMKQAQQLGVTSKFIVWGLQDLQYAQSTPGITYVSTAGPAPTATESVYPGLQKWDDQYSQQFGKATSNATYALTFYCYMHQLVAAMQKAGTVSDTKKIADAFKGLSLTCISRQGWDAQGKYTPTLGALVVADGKTTLQQY